MTHELVISKTCPVLADMNKLCEVIKLLPFDAKIRNIDSSPESDNIRISFDSCVLGGNVPRVYAIHHKIQYELIESQQVKI